MPDPDDIIIAVNLKSLLQVKVLAEEGTYVDLKEEKEYSVVKLTNIFLAGLEYSNIGECFFLLQVTPNYIASGGDGYKFESWKTRDRILGSLDTEVLCFSSLQVDIFV